MPEKSITAKDEVKVQQYELRPHQLKWLDTQVELRESSTKKISEASKLSKTNWYQWIKEPGFEDAYFAEYERKTRRWRPYLDKIGLEKAPKEYNYWRDMQKVAGRQEQPGIQINSLQGLIQVNVKDK